MTRTWRIAMVVLAQVALAATMAAGCQPQQPAKEQQGPDIGTITPGVITVGADTAYPPFESAVATPQAGGAKYEGFDVDLGDAIAAKLGVKWEVVSTAWDGIIPGLQAGKYDVIMSAMTITDERKQQITPSYPYILSDQSIAVKKGSTIKEPRDLKGKKVGVQVDTTGQFEAEKTLGKAYKDLKKYDDILLAFQDLRAGRVDAVVNDLPGSQWIIDQNYKDQMELAKVIKTDEAYGIWVKQGNTKLLEAINKALEEVIADGTYAQIYEKWFGAAPDMAALKAVIDKAKAEAGGAGGTAAPGAEEATAAD